MLRVVLIYYSTYIDRVVEMMLVIPNVRKSQIHEIQYMDFHFSFGRNVENPVENNPFDGSFLV